MNFTVTIPEQHAHRTVSHGNAVLHGLFFTALLCAPATHAEIVQRHVLSAIASKPDGEGADVMTMATASACGGRQLRMDAQSLRLDDTQYATLKRELQQRLRNKTPMLAWLASACACQDRSTPPTTPAIFPQTNW